MLRHLRNLRVTALTLLASTQNESPKGVLFSVCFTCVQAVMIKPFSKGFRLRQSFMCLKLEKVLQNPDMNPSTVIFFK